MSNPNFGNIEQWLFEYAEGNLSAHQEAMLLGFISENPELIPELQAWKKAKIEKEKDDKVSALLISNLTKAPPFYLEPLSLASLVGSFAFTFLFLFGNHFEEAHYLTENLPLEMITAKKEPNFVSKNGQKDNFLQNKNVKTIYLENQKPEPMLVSSFSNSVNKKEKTAEKKETDWTAYISLVKQDYLPNKENASYQNISHSSKSAKARTQLTELLRELNRITSKPISFQNTKLPYYHTPMLPAIVANPAMAGIGNQLQITSRLQWEGRENSQLLNTLSWSNYIPELRGGIGLIFNYNNYNVGDLNSYTTKIIYSPKFTLNKNISIEPAVSFKMGNINLKQNAKIIGSHIELDRQNVLPLFVNENTANGEQLWYKDIGLGVMLNTKWFYASLNVDNIGRHNNNYYSSDITKSYKEPLHYIAVAGTEYQPITKPIKLVGYVLYQNYGNLKELWVGGNFQYKWLGIGAGISSQADVGGSIGLLFKQFVINYNLDYTKSRLINRQLLSHQMSMLFFLNSPPKGEKRKVNF